MTHAKILILTVTTTMALSPGLRAEKKPEDPIAFVTNTIGLVAFWTFQEEAGQPRLSVATKHSLPLEEQAGKVARIVPEDGAPFGRYAAQIREGQWLLLPREKIGPLNFHGKDTQFSVIAWVKRDKKTMTPERCEAIAGIWDEPRNLRQYCLFLNIRVNKNHPKERIQDKVSAHVSVGGGATPGFKWAYDVAQSKTSVPHNEWVCAAFTYDGKEVRAYYNGVCEEHEGYNPYKFPDGIYDGGEKGSGFKVGVTDELHGKKCNWFAGTVGGIALFDRALTAAEMKTLALPTSNLTRQ
jgi:hypothetical protein